MAGIVRARVEGAEPCGSRARLSRVRVDHQGPVCWLGVSLPAAYAFDRQLRAGEDRVTLRWTDTSSAFQIAPPGTASISRPFERYGQGQCNRAAPVTPNLFIGFYYFYVRRLMLASAILKLAFRTFADSFELIRDSFQLIRACRLEQRSVA